MAHTWRTFTTAKEAQAYADACWAVFLKRAASDQVPSKASLSKYPADVDAATDQIKALSKTDADAATSELKATVLRGRDASGAVVTGRGVSIAWASPTVTADGQFSVPCPEFDAKGGPEPKWPAPALVGKGG